MGSQSYIHWIMRRFGTVVLIATLVNVGCTSIEDQNGESRSFLSTNQFGDTESLNLNNGKIWLLLDRSGSMDLMRSDVITGFNLFVSELKAQPLECQMTLIFFDGFRQSETVFSAEQIQDISKLRSSDYIPDGQTPFYDALGNLIVGADNRINSRIANGQPDEDQLIVVLTDGLENASFLYTQRIITNLIEDRQSEGWTFVFLGANQDSYAEGAKIGLTGGNIQNFKMSGQSIALAFESVSRATIEYCSKSSVQRGTSKGNFFGGIKEAEEGS